jgi:hypothetical protein
VGEPTRDWDGWLDRLVQDKTADIRASLIGEISRAISHSEALRAGDADRLAEIAVDCIIESTHSNQIRPI